MTAPSGPILFNSVTGGSDTEASGLGPIPAVFGAGASTTAASAVVTGIDTTGVTAGDLLWVQSTSGRQFSIIATVDSGTQVTCDDVFANTEASRTWAIGGKRASLSGASSVTILSATGAKGGWTLRFESGHVDTPSVKITVTASGDATGGRLVIEGEPNAVTMPIVRSGSSFQGFEFNGGGSLVTLRNFKIECTTANNGQKFHAAVGFTSTSSNDIVLEGLVIDDVDWNHGIHLNLQSLFHVRNCKIANCYSHGIFSEGVTAGIVLIEKSRIDSVGGVGIYFSGAAFRNVHIRENVFSDIVSHGIHIVGTFNQTTDISLTAGFVERNIFFDCGEDSIRIDMDDAITARTIGIRENVFAQSAGYHINFTALTSTDTTLYSPNTRQNAFYLATIGFRNNLAEKEDDITLTADPFTWSKTLTAVSWTFATKRLNKTGGFAGVHVGQSVNVTGGTGVTPGLYAIASVDSNDQITLVASIAGADTADVTTAPDFNINNHAGGGAALRAATVVLP